MFYKKPIFNGLKPLNVVLPAVSVPGLLAPSAGAGIF